MPEIEKIKIGSRKCPFNIVKLQGNFRVLLKMASDSEGLRQISYYVFYLSHFLLKMASDSEGLRQILACSSSNLLNLRVENGFRFGRVTTFFG